MGMYDRDSNTPQGGGGFSRIAIAALIGIVGLIVFMWHTEDNPVTGKRQHVSLSPTEEIRLGLESAPKMAEEMGGELSKSDARTKVVKEVGNNIVSHTAASKSPWKFEFHLLGDTETINAFALPGGQIFITEGLFDKLDTEAQLAGVLSHEMGHVIERHTAQQMAKSDLGKWFIIAIGAGTSDQQNYGANNSVLIASFVNHMMQLRYGRKDESEADIWGVKLMSQVGFDPTAMIQVMNILKAEKGKGHSLEMFESHPDPDKRIRQIQDYLKNNPTDENKNEGRKLKEMINQYGG